MEPPSAYTIEATETSLTVLETLVDSGEPTGVTALADRIGVSKSVVHNHLSTLRARGYVVKHGNRYRPALRTLGLGTRTRDSIDTVRAAKPKVDNLAAATGETTALFVLEEHYGVPAYVVERDDGADAGFQVGERLPLPVNAPGKAILATLPDDRVCEILDATDLSVLADTAGTDPDELEARIRRIRDDGIAFSREEHHEGVVGVAAPIDVGDEHEVAALGVCGPVDRLNGRYLEEDIPGQVLSTVKSIQVDLTSG